MSTRPFRFRSIKLLFFAPALAAGIFLYCDDGFADHQSKRQRIIALAPHIVELLYAIGAGDQIIATSAFSDYPEQASSIPRIGNYSQLQMERIVAMKPDIIISWRRGNPAADLEKLIQLGFNLVDSSPNKLEDVAVELISLGRLTDHESVARTIADAYLDRLLKLRRRYDRVSDVRVFYELWSRPLTTIANQSWLQQQLDVCRAQNPFAQAVGDYPQVSLEQVLSIQPEIVIQPQSPTDRNKDALNWRLWPSVPAVKNNLIIHPDADRLHRMTPRMLDALTRLCQQIDRARKISPINKKY